MRRTKQALDREVCKRILTEEKRGVLAVNGDAGYPYAIPMDFFFEPLNCSIYLHSACNGHKIDAIKQNDKVCFTVWNQGERKKDDWSYFVDSVICFGYATIVKDESERNRYTKQLGLKYYPSESEVDNEMNKAFDRMLLIRIDIEHMTGKHVHER